MDLRQRSASGVNGVQPSPKGALRRKNKRNESSGVATAVMALILVLVVAAGSRASGRSLQTADNQGATQKEESDSIVSRQLIESMQDENDKLRKQVQALQNEKTKLRATAAKEPVLDDTKTTKQLE